jgi:histone H3/H4
MTRRKYATTLAKGPPPTIMVPDVDLASEPHYDRAVTRIVAHMTEGTWTASSARTIADELGIEVASVARLAAEAGRRIRWAAGGVEALRTSVQAQLQRIAAFDSGARCESCGRPDHRDTAVAVRALEVMGRVYHLDRAPTRIVDMPDFVILRDALDEALAPYPEAREAVGRALGDAARASRSEERAGAREAASRRRRRSPNATAPAASEGDRGD